MLRAFRRAGIDAPRPRRTGPRVAPFTSSNADVSVYTLMKLLGHESMVTSQCYDAAVRVLASEPTRSGSFADT